MMNPSSCKWEASLFYPEKSTLCIKVRQCEGLEQIEISHHRALPNSGRPGTGKSWWSCAKGMRLTQAKTDFLFIECVRDITESIVPKCTITTLELGDLTKGTKATRLEPFYKRSRSMARQDKRASFWGEVPCIHQRRRTVVQKGKS
jgi:hypothetical protein